MSPIELPAQGRSMAIAEELDWRTASIPGDVNRVVGDANGLMISQ